MTQNGKPPQKPAKPVDMECARPSVKTAKVADPMKPVMRLLKEMYGRDSVCDFGPLKLKAVRQRLIDLRLEHRDLDEVIGRMADEPDMDDFQIRRLKKRKLALKDEITRLEDQLVPDLIA